MNDAAAGGISLLLLMGLFIISLVLLVVWIVLPFAVLGTKPLLRQLLREQQRTNVLLESVLQRPLSATTPTHQPPKPPG